MKEQTENQIKTDAIVDFVTMMIGALDSGFVTENRPTIAQIHRVAQNYVKDTYGIETPHIVEQWGEEVAKLCGYQQQESE
jgi:hypothetical protein